MVNYDILTEHDFLMPIHLKNKKANFWSRPLKMPT